MGRMTSFIMLTNVENKPGSSVEWVRENFPLLEKYSPKRDVFPSPPGVYVLRIDRVPDIGHSIPGLFTVKPLLFVENYPLIIFQNSADQEAQLSHDSIYPGSVRLWLNKTRALLPDVDFSVDNLTGAITFLRETPTGDTVHADYYYEIDNQGPFQFTNESSNMTAIPGAVIAFGDRIELGDEMAIKVMRHRHETAEVFGGKFETTFELLVFSRDAEDREKMSDYVIGKILEIQNRIGFEGLELLDIAPGGENEDVYNAEIDDYYYESSVSMTLRVDWESQFSLPVDVWRVEMTSKRLEERTGYLDGSFFLDKLKVGDYANIAGAMNKIGRGSELTYERIT